MLKWVLVIMLILVMCIILLVLLSSLKIASNFDDEVEELCGSCYEDDGLDETYDYYDEKYK